MVGVQSARKGDRPRAQRHHHHRILKRTYQQITSALAVKQAADVFRLREPVKAFSTKIKHVFDHFICCFA